MIEVDVEARRKPAPLAARNAARYLILGDFGARSSGTVSVDRDNLDDVLAGREVSLAGTRLREIEDFHPDRLFRSCEIFRDLREDQPEPAPSRPQASPQPDLGKMLRPPSLLEQIAAGGDDPLQQYIREVARAHGSAPASNPKASQKTKECADRMRALLRHSRFQPVEAAWRGLDFVVRRMDDETARIHIAQLSKKDLAADLLDATDLTATRTYSLLTGREWQGIFGLYAFGGETEDIGLLGRIALLASNAKVPFVAEGNVDMGEQWDELRSIPEAGHIGLALPRMLLRLPYGSRTSPIEAFEFEEMPGTPEHSGYLWGSPALACLAILSRGEAREEEEDELDLCHLPLHSYQEDGDWKTTPCAEVLLTQAHVEALMDLGLMPIVSFRDTDRVRLAGFRAINGKGLLNT
jgi:type VI secretion system protein ImpC